MNRISPAFPVRPAIAASLGALTDPQGLLDYETFTRAALYDPEWGYYRRKAPRVGKSDAADFYTSSSHTLVFPLLLIDACKHLLEVDDLRDYHWVEIGAEDHPIMDATHAELFASCSTFRLDDAVELLEPCIVMSNELLDAQPFQRWVYLNGHWRPIRILLENDNLCECIVPDSLSDSKATILKRLPDTAPEGYRVDVSLEAEQLLTRILKDFQSGLFLTIDYGKPWEAILTECPEGTARAYQGHAQNPDILKDPGEQDLTCDVCWDFIIDALESEGFEKPKLNRQESFFMRQAPDAIRSIVTRPSNLTDPLKGQLLELISPTHFGSRFQVLSATKKQCRNH